MRFFKFNFKKIQKNLKNIVFFLIEKGLLTIILIFIFSFLLGFFVFFKYEIPPPLLEERKKKIEFDEKLFERVLKTWQEREENFQKIDSKEYLNLFK